MKVVKIEKDGMTRTFWSDRPVLACVRTWANQNVRLNSQRCDHRVCALRIAKLLQVGGVFYVGAGKMDERAIHVTLNRNAQWSDVEPEVLGLIKRFRPVG